MEKVSFGEVIGRLQLIMLKVMSFIIMVVHMLPQQQYLQGVLLLILISIGV